MTSLSAGTRQTRLQKIVGLVEDSIEGQKVTAEALRGFLPILLESLKDSAKGHFREETGFAKDGKVYTRVYTISPNMSAASLLIQLMNMSPKNSTDTLLSYMRAEQVAEEVEAGLAKAKTRNLDALTGFTEEQSTVFSKSLVTEDDITRSVMQVLSVLSQFITSIPREQMMQEYCASEEAYQMFKVAFGEAGIIAYKQALTGRPGAIEGHTEGEDTDDAD